ncbi:hypothetical protein B296_00020928 [Ensete ventricosum]|uniref:BHLH domain-containing protein n=1 Tax=Ensete ventricosum TaxID=4639 RepID=A0A426YF86_ENSVE|nr:hypothetical protein B296_00020928 [Ensete ventricosum]
MAVKVVGHEVAAIRKIVPPGRGPHRGREREALVGPVGEAEGNLSNKPVAFGSHGRGGVGAAGAFGGSSHTATACYPDLPLVGDNKGNNSSDLEDKMRLPGFSHDDQTINDASMGLELDLHHQFDLEPKQEISTHLMQAGSYPQCFDPATLSYSAAFGMPADVFFAELPPDGLYDPAVHYGPSNPPFMVREVLGSFPHAAGFFAAGSRGSGESYVIGTEDGHGGQLLESPHVRNKRQQGAPWGMKQGGLKNEKQRRERLGKKFEDLKSLIPNSTKPDRASIVADTIEYINELLRTVDELKILVDKKRRWRERARKTATGDQAAGDMESSSITPPMDDADRASKGVLRSSWLQRRSKDTFVDVRIVDDEANIKLTRRKMMNCLLIVAKVLDELHLELLHLSGGNVGYSHIFMINTKVSVTLSQVLSMPSSRV